MTLIHSNEQKYQVENHLKITYMKAPTFYLFFIFALGVQTAKLQKPKLLTNIFGNSNTRQNIAFYMGKIPY